MAKKPSADVNNGRRKFLGMAGKAAVGASMIGISASALAVGKGGSDSVDHSTLRYDDNLWNRDAMARLQADLNLGKQKFGWYAGTVNGVRHGERVRPLCGFEGFSFARLLDLGDGVYQKLLREVGFYTDLETGDILEHFDNPYTGERVKVIPVANDPFNFKIGPHYPDPPSYGGLNTERPPKRPLLLDWRETGNNSVFLRTPIHLLYPSALQPDEWPRESSGAMNRVSEMFTYVIDKNDLADPTKTSVEYSGCWSRITPWLPWMLMGQAEGHVYYDCMMGAYNDMRVLSPKVKDYAEKHYPKYFNAPTEYEEPSFSSLENYAREQRPAPVKKLAD